ncbi:MAG TPA: glycosyltransferase family 4 protein [Terriglobales bacterium]|nr:glycosyltransferase family 4 protein [Terriglobales bacterium]
MKRRLVLLTEIIAPYRIPVFNKLVNQDGIDLHVIFLAESDPSLREWLVYKDEIQFSYEVLPSWRHRLGKYNFLLNSGVTETLRRSSPDVIVCGGYNYIASWQSAIWAKRHQIPFLLWVESTAKDQREGHLLLESMKSMFMRNCDAFIAAGVSSFEYLRSFGLPREAIFIAPNAVDIEFFTERADMVRADSAPHRLRHALPDHFALFVGRLVREKGVFDLLRAYSQLTPKIREELSLVLVGDGEAHSELKRRAAEIYPGRIDFAGFLQREQLVNYYALADMFIMPTHSDPWGLVVNEAMACGLPVICSNIAGCVADLVEDGRNGLIFPAGDSTALTNAMSALAGDAELRVSMGRRSKERILRNSPEACASGIAHAVLESASAAYV